VGGPPLPKSKIVKQQFVDIDFTSPYVPAPIDDVSLVNGVLKFDHSQCLLDQGQISYLIARFEETFAPVLSLKETLTPEQAVERINLTSASGWPYSGLYGPTKGDAIEKLGIDVLHENFQQYTPLSTSTLKVELRLAGKDSRLFRMSDVATVLKGQELFGLQNDRLIAHPMVNHIATGFPTPGPILCNIWTVLARSEKRGFKFLSGDGSQWDAHFPLAFAQVICECRKRFLPEHVHEDIDRYYSSMYNGYTVVAGLPYHLIGNPSGHINTSTDNSLLQLMLIWLFQRQFDIRDCDCLYWVCGDDLIVGSSNEAFTGNRYNEFCNTFGVYMEFLSETTTPFDELLFIGSHPVRDGSAIIKYCYDEVRQMSVLCYTRKGLLVHDYLSACASIATNTFYSSTYDRVIQLMHQITSTYDLVDEKARSLLQSCSRHRLHMVYNGFE
jgi:hypothetical protein